MRFFHLEFTVLVVFVYCPYRWTKLQKKWDLMIFKSPSTHFIRCFWGLLRGSEFHFLAIVQFGELLQITLKKCISTTNQMPWTRSLFLIRLHEYNFLVNYTFYKKISFLLKRETIESHSTLLTRGALLEILELNSMAWIICRI